MLALVFSGLLFPHQFDPVWASARAERALRAQMQAHERVGKERSTRERREFERCFHALGKAFDSFTRADNAGRGHIWPQEAASLAKAMRELGRTVTGRPVASLGRPME